MQKVQSIREKLRRKLSIHDKNHFDDHDDVDDVDDETNTRLQKEFEEAEKEDLPMGKPGSFLNRLIAHGNKKTEDQLAAETATASGAKGSSSK